MVASLSIARPRSAAAVPTCVADATSGVRWIRASPAREHAELDRWCAGVGSPARIEAPRGTASSGAVAVVSWNTHVGAGDLDGLVRDLRSGRMTGRPMPHFVLLLQEVFRAGAGVPNARELRAEWAGAQQPPRNGGTREDIVTAAERLGLHMVYVPSMRNGKPGATDEDRGNAIVATMPLSEVTAIELPLERQRRVAIDATVTVAPSGGRAVPIRIVCTHFTNVVLHRLLLLSESGRVRQARALANVLPGAGPLIIGGDFNAWFGYRDAAYKTLVKLAQPAASEDQRATFGPLRLDHMLFRLPPGWSTSVKRADDRYGSDHYPLIAVIQPAVN